MRFKIFNYLLGTYQVSIQVCVIQWGINVTE